MRLSAKAILNYANTNNFEYGNQWVIRAGDPNTLYFQLVDLDKSPLQAVPLQFLRGGSSSSPALRYMVGVGSSNQPFQVTTTFPSIDDAKVITLIASQADASDASIWKVSIPSSQTPNTGNVQFSVAEGTAIRTFSVRALLQVEYTDNGCDGTTPNNNSTGIGGGQL